MTPEEVYNETLDMAKTIIKHNEALDSLDIIQKNTLTEAQNILLENHKVARLCYEAEEWEETPEEKEIFEKAVKLSKPIYIERLKIVQLMGVLLPYAMVAGIVAIAYFIFT